MAPSLFRLPAETDPHERVWMAFPPERSLRSLSTEDAAHVRETWAQLIRTVAGFEQVNVVVDPAEESRARDALGTGVSADITVVPLRLDHPWIGLTGPGFTLGTSTGGAPRLGAQDFAYNGFGRQPGLDFRNDASLGRGIAEHAGAERVTSVLTVERGAWLTDGEGTVLLSEEALLDPARNPGWSREQVEREFRRGLDVGQVIWLPGGLSRPPTGGESGTARPTGQIDQVVAFASPGVVLLHWQDDPEHPDHEVSARTLDALAGQTDAQDRPINVASLPAPAGPDGASYVSGIPLNGALLAPTFQDEHDDDAHQVLEAAYPGRQVVLFPADLFAQHGLGLRHAILPEPATTPLV